MSLQVAVFLAAHAALSLFRASGCAASVVYLCVSGITVGALLPVLLSIILIRAVCEIMSLQVAILLAALFAHGLLCASGFAAAVGFLCVSGIAAGALHPVIVLAVLPYRKIVAFCANRLCLCSAASRAGKGLFARCCAGRRGGHCATVPAVGGCFDGVAVGAFSPVPAAGIGILCPFTAVTVLADREDRAVLACDYVARRFIIVCEFVFCRSD